MVDSTSEVGPQRILVTGAAGFIGSHLCERLLLEGHRVWGLDNFDPFYHESVKRENLGDVIAHPSMRLVEGDVRDSVLLDGLFTDVPFDAVVHLAARPGINVSLDTSALCVDVNVGGTVHLLEVMRRRHVSRLVYASSAAVYGSDSVVPFEEDSVATAPSSPYGASKRAGELMVRAWHQMYGLSAVCLRFFSVYGPRQRPDLVFHRFAESILADRPPLVSGNEDAGRDYVYVSDAVEAVTRSLNLLSRGDVDGGARFETLNVGTGTSVALAEAMEEMARALGRRSRTRMRKIRSGDSACVYASTVRLEQALGFRPSTRLERGMALFGEWLAAGAPVGTT